MDPCCIYAEELSNSVQSIELNADSSALSIERQIEASIKSEATPVLPAGYELSNCLSEGCMGKVFLVMNKTTKDCLAAKVVSMSGSFTNSSDLKQKNLELLSERIRKDLKREADIHKKLRHHNICAFYGIRNTPNYGFMFMELITGGELFERIPIDIGLHVQEIAYEGPPADIFSLGVTLVTAVTGQRCWNRANSETDKLYELWLNPGKLVHSVQPFCRLPTDLINFLIHILHDDPQKRLKGEEIKKHPWYQRGLRKCLTPVSLPPKVAQGSIEYMCELHLKRTDGDSEQKAHTTVPLSQPNYMDSLMTVQNDTDHREYGPRAVPLLSQPVDSAAMMLSATQQHLGSRSCSIVAPGSSRVSVDHMMRRMTRFFSSLHNEVQLMNIIHMVIAQRPSLREVKRGVGNIIVEIRISDLPVTTFRILLYTLAGSLLVDCRRISGDGLLFHQVYRLLYHDLKQMNSIDETHPHLRMVLPKSPHHPSEFKTAT